jgi:DNA-binding transcriptional ArsR family regulator
MIDIKRKNSETSVMATSSSQSTVPPDATLADDGPVAMPALPPKLVLTTEQQLKALADALRTRILVLLQHQPATAKQIADRLGAVPGTVGHHLQVLEDAGLVQVVARRLVHGIVAKYYMRAARIFIMEFPPEVMGTSSLNLDLLNEARNELAEALGVMGNSAVLEDGFPHARLSAERAQFYQQRLRAFFEDLMNETPDTNGQVYGLSAVFFLAPPSLQVSSPADSAPSASVPDDTTQQ